MGSYISTPAPPSGDLVPNGPTQCNNPADINMPVGFSSPIGELKPQPDNGLMMASMIALVEHQMEDHQVVDHQVTDNPSETGSIDPPSANTIPTKDILPRESIQTPGDISKPVRTRAWKRRQRRKNKILAGSQKN